VLSLPGEIAKNVGAVRKKHRVTSFQRDDLESFASVVIEPETCLGLVKVSPLEASPRLVEGCVQGFVLMSVVKYV
jgi:hypothetical protein